ncbi:MAG: T9SS type A sorting domain-containing protein, partial [Ignavibacteria bacterium]|nr:T9SS type A sorting domain-containing protein [Ignavibacteria bacterium]
PNTIIGFSIPENVKSETSNVKLIIFNTLGNEVADLVNEKKNAGNYSVQFDGSKLSSGIYFYTLSVNGNVIDTKSMVLVK